MRLSERGKFARRSFSTLHPPLPPHDTTLSYPLLLANPSVPRLCPLPAPSVYPFLTDVKRVPRTNVYLVSLYHNPSASVSHRFSRSFFVASSSRRLPFGSFLGQPSRRRAHPSPRTFHQLPCFYASPDCTRI